MTADDEKDPPVPADVEGKIPKKVHDKPRADDGEAQALDSDDQGGRQ